MKKILLFLILFVTIFYAENVYADKAKCVYNSMGYTTIYTVDDECKFNVSTTGSNNYSRVAGSLVHSVDMNKSFFTGVNCPSNLYYGYNGGTGTDLFEVSKNNNFTNANVKNSIKAPLNSDESYTDGLQSCFDGESGYQARCVYEASNFKVSYIIDDNCNVKFETSVMGDTNVKQHYFTLGNDSYSIEKDKSFFVNGSCPSNIYFGYSSKNPNGTTLYQLSKSPLTTSDDISSVAQVGLKKSESYVNEQNCLDGDVHAFCTYKDSLINGDSFTVTYTLYSSCNVKYTITSSNPKNKISVGNKTLDASYLASYDEKGKASVQCPSNISFGYWNNNSEGSYNLVAVGKANEFQENSYINKVTIGNIESYKIDDATTCFNSSNRIASLNRKFEFCNSKGVLTALSVIHTIVTITKIVAPLILIIVGTISLGKASVNGDEKAIKDATNSLIKKSIMGVAIFLLPFVTDFIIDLVGNKAEGSKSSDFPFCADCLTGNDNCEDHIKNSSNR